MASNGGNKNPTSWGVVIFFLIIFWPVGLWLLIRNLSTDKSTVYKKTAIKNGKIFTIIGWVLIVIGIICCLPSGSDGTTTTDTANSASSIVSILIFFCGGGLAIVYVGHRMKSKAKRYNKYIAIVESRKIKSIHDIAKAIPTNDEMAMKDLQNMIDHGYLENAYIDMAKRELVITCEQVMYDTNVNTTTQAYTSAQTYTQTPPITKVVQCKNCGANNTITVGEYNGCEYCGSPLS